MAYRFGEFVLEPKGHRLLRGTQEFPLRPKTFQTLLYLVEHHDRVVSKDELLEEVWAGSFVVETVVAHSISELRAILEENAHLPRYIKTVPKVGYRFISDVAPAESTSGAGTAVRQPRHSIAVMPFRDMSPSGDMEYFCEGLSEEIINALTHFPELRVAARTSSFAFRKRACDAKEIGEKLNVETVLEGSLRTAGERLRVGAQLVEAAEGFHLWSEQFDCEMGDVLTIQDRISQKIVEHLQIGILLEEGRSRSGRNTNNEDAYLLNMKGRHLMHRETQEDIARAIEYFRKASEADAGYVHPYVGLSLCYSSLGFWNHLDLAEAYREARRSAITAVEIDPESAQAHAALGFAALISDWDWESADRSLRRSIELDPRSDWVRSLRAAYLLAVGRTAEAVAESRKAIELEPLSNFANVYHGWCLLRDGQLEKAIRQLEVTLELEPLDPRARFLLGQAYVLDSRFSEGLYELRKAVGDSQNNSLILAGLGWACAVAGERAEALQIIEQIRGRFSREYPRPYLIGKVFAGLGETDQAFKWLEVAFRDHDTSMAFFKSDETLTSLSGDPRFSLLLQRMSLEPPDSTSTARKD